MSGNDVARTGLADLKERVMRLEDEMGKLRERLAALDGQMRLLVILVGLASVGVQIIGILVK